MAMFGDHLEISGAAWRGRGGGRGMRNQQSCLSPENGVFHISNDPELPLLCVFGNNCFGLYKLLKELY